MAEQLRLAIACADIREAVRWGGLNFGASGFILVVLHPDADEAGEVLDGLEVPWRAVAQEEREGPLIRPDFGRLVDALADADACLLVGEDTWVRLVRLVAGELGLPIFTVVDERWQLGRSQCDEGERPDLFLLADEDLLPAAVHDPRYGSTVLPVGRPSDPVAVDRLLDALDRWRLDLLEPSQPELSIIVPAYNEEANVAMVCERLVAATAGLAAEILVVDDHSDDATLSEATKQMWYSPRVRALSKPLPRGMGNAIRFGLAAARAPYVAVTMGDGSDEVERIPEMFAKVRDEGYGLAIGSRYRHRINYASVPRIYRFWSACFRMATRLFIGFKLSDYTNAFRVFDRRIFERYGPESGGFEISPEITFKAWYATRRVAEVDVRHLKRASGQSSFSFLRAGPGYGRILFKAWVQRLTGRWFVLDW